MSLVTKTNSAECRNNDKDGRQLCEEHWLQGFETWTVDDDTVALADLNAGRCDLERRRRQIGDGRPGEL